MDIDIERLEISKFTLGYAVDTVDWFFRLLTVRHQTTIRALGLNLYGCRSMTNPRFPVLGTDLTVPWEVAEEARSHMLYELDKTPEAFKVQGRYFLLSLIQEAEYGGFTPFELDTWYNDPTGKDWREMAR